MDIFPGWEGYLPKLEANWRKLIAPGDTVVLVGDTSWAMNLKDTREDFAFLQSLPGEKWILKGNHDYWWTTRAKMERFLADNGFTSLHILHNNACTVDGISRARPAAGTGCPGRCAEPPGQLSGHGVLQPCQPYPAARDQ